MCPIILAIIQSRAYNFFKIIKYQIIQIDTWNWYLL